MAHKKRPEFIRHGFNNIAADYDRINDVMTFGLHRRWKRELVRWLNISEGDAVLDLCCGTGDLGYLSCPTVGNGCVVGLDFAPDMIAIARERAGWCVSERRPFFIRADALRLPFPDGSFTAVTVGYGLRNLADLSAGLAEIARVLRPEGRLAILDTSLPDCFLLRELHRLYLLYGIPLIGRFIHGAGEMYGYLASSAFAFLNADELSAQCGIAGLTVERVKRFLFGASVAILVAKSRGRPRQGSGATHST